MFVKELGKKAGVPSVYTLPFYMLGNGNLGCKSLGVEAIMRLAAAEMSI